MIHWEFLLPGVLNSGLHWAQLTMVPCQLPDSFIANHFIFIKLNFGALQKYIPSNKTANRKKNSLFIADFVSYRWTMSKRNLGTNSQIHTNQTPSISMLAEKWPYSNSTVYFCYFNWHSTLPTSWQKVNDTILLHGKKKILIQSSQTKTE